VRRHFYSVAAVAAAALVGSSAFGAAIRVDTNGEMVGTNNTPGVPDGGVPLNWTVYNTGSGGGQAYRYDTGGSSNVFSVNFEDEDARRNAAGLAGQVGVYPAGHSVLFGGNTSLAAAGTYGLQQTINSTAGKVYWISGGQNKAADWSTNELNHYRFQFGMDNGTGLNGLESFANVRSTSNMNLGRFSHSIVATGSQVTAHVGMRVIANTNTSDINMFADGIRVMEMDVPINTSLQNGGFEGSATDISNYNAKGGSGYAQNDLLDGWIPLGGSVGQRTIYNKDAAVFLTGANSFQFDQNKGQGRMYAMQRVDGGGAGSTYLLTGSFRNDSATESNAQIGIDPTGGLDPTAASVIWSTPSATAATWIAASINGGNAVTDVSGNGVTIFLAAGLANTAARSGGDSGGRFDNLGLTIVDIPEPGSIGVLALAALPLVRRARRGQA
jgi:hypothetical protein